jgi:hypothetical protein
MKADWGSILGQSDLVRMYEVYCTGCVFGDRGGKSSGMCVRGLMQNGFVGTKD